MARNTHGLKHGGPGRPKGVPNKATVEVKAACAAIVDDPVYRQTLAKRAKAGKLAPAVECMLWYYAKGKPTEHVSVDGDLNLRVIIEARERLAGKLAGLSARIGATAVSGESE